MKEALDDISNKLFESSVIDKHILNGRVTNIFLTIDSKKIIINIEIENREELNINDEEWSQITSEVNSFLNRKKLWNRLYYYGLNKDMFDGFDVNLINSDL